MAKAVDGLQTFKDLDLKDLRNLDVDERNELVDEIDAGSSLDEALALLEVHMGFSAEDMSEIVKTTPIGGRFRKRKKSYAKRASMLEPSDTA